MVKHWLKEHVLELILFFVISGIATPIFFLKDNDYLNKAVVDTSYEKCKPISTQFIKQNCYQKVWERYRDNYCPDYALNGNVDGCRQDMLSRMKGLRPASRFPLKFLIYLFLEFILGLYFFYLKEKWSSW